MTRVLALLMYALFLPESAEAIVCVAKGSESKQVRTEFEQSTVVFSGYVLDVAHDSDVPTATLSVIQVWKGSIEVGQTVTTSAEESVFFYGDGVVPQKGTALLVYANEGQPFFLSSCSRTRILDSATGDIPLLNKLSKKSRYRLGG